MEHVLTSPITLAQGWKQITVNTLLASMLGLLLLSQASSCVEEKEHDLHDYLDDDKISILTTSD